MEHELEKLLGAFAAETLTAEEKQQLYAAALEDQQLFNALADEQALRELLADPAVRRRLLASLNRMAETSPSAPSAWVQWLRRPVHLAYAGGLTAALLALVFGIKIYQDTQRQTIQSMATEQTHLEAPSPPGPSDIQPAPPEPAESSTPPKESALPSAETMEKDRFTDQSAARKSAASAEGKDRPSSTGEPDQPPQRAKQGEPNKPAAQPPTGPAKKAEESNLAARQAESERLPLPPAATASGQRTEAPSAATPAPPIAGARALFYAAEPDRLDQMSRTSEQEDGLKSTDRRRSPRSEQKTKPPTADSGEASAKPLGLRYGFAVLTTEGLGQETDAATALNSGEQGRLTLEVNQDAYVQIWKTVGSAAPQLWFPTKETGQVSVPVPAGRRQGIPLVDEDNAFTLTIRLSRIPLRPVGAEDALTLGKPANQLEETIAPHDSSGHQERATYVVNPNPSPTVQLTVSIPLTR